jgi:hypothetical protein
MGYMIGAPGFPVPPHPANPIIVQRFLFGGMPTVSDSKSSHSGSELHPPAPASPPLDDAEPPLDVAPEVVPLVALVPLVPPAVPLEEPPPLLALVVPAVPEDDDPLPPVPPS